MLIVNSKASEKSFVRPRVLGQVQRSKNEENVKQAAHTARVHKALNFSRIKL